MDPVNIIAVAVILLIVGGALAYIIKAKKSGKKCIGCPDGCCASPGEAQEESSACTRACHLCSHCQKEK